MARGRRKAARASRRAAKTTRKATKRARRQKRLVRKTKRRELKADRKDRRITNKQTRQTAKHTRKMQQIEQREDEPLQDEQTGEVEPTYNPDQEEQAEALATIDEETGGEFSEEEQDEPNEELAEESYEEYASRKTRPRRKKKRGGLGKVVRSLGAFALLAPFLPAMKLMLVAKGFSGGEAGGLDPATIAIKFHKHIIKKEQYEGQDHYEHFTGAVAQGIVKTIISFFKNLKEKQKAGEEMTESEKKLLAVGDQVNKEGKQLKKDSMDSAIGQFFSDYWWLFLIAFIIYYANKGKSA